MTRSLPFTDVVEYQNNECGILDNAIFKSFMPLGMHNVGPNLSLIAYNLDCLVLFH